MNVTERFLNYVVYDTQSKESDPDYRARISEPEPLTTTA